MKSCDVLNLGRELLNKHGLRDWLFALDRSKQRFGICKNWLQVISLSEPLCSLNGEEEVRDTILHEIAHALAGCCAGHGWKWKQIARNIGHSGERCYSTSRVAMPKKKVSIECPKCSHIIKRYKRLPKKREYSCARCYRDKGSRIKLICYTSLTEREELLKGETQHD